MQDLPKNVLIGSMIVAGLVALYCIADLVIGTGHTMLMDILFIVCAAIVGYLGWDALKEMS